MTEGGTRLSRKELDRFRDLLLAKLKEHLGDLSDLADEEKNLEAGLGIPRDPADRSLEEEQEGLLRDLERNEREEVREILAALRRIESGAYGVCERTGKPISRARLEAIPWARHTVEVARELEQETSGGG